MPDLKRKHARGSSLTTEQLIKIFQEHDKNGDGRLNKEELKKAFQNLGAVIPGWRAWCALLSADSDGDGFISDSEMACLANFVVQLGYTIA